MFNAPLDHGCGQQSHWSARSFTESPAVLPYFLSSSDWYLLPMQSTSLARELTAWPVPTYYNILQHITTYYSYSAQVGTVGKCRQSIKHYQTLSTFIKCTLFKVMPRPSQASVHMARGIFDFLGEQEFLWKSWGENSPSISESSASLWKCINMAIWGIYQSFLDTPTYPMCHFKPESLVTGY